MTGPHLNNLLGGDDSQTPEGVADCVVEDNDWYELCLGGEGTEAGHVEVTDAGGSCDRLHQWLPRRYTKPCVYGAVRNQGKGGCVFVWGVWVRKCVESQPVAIQLIMPACCCARDKS